MFNYAYIIIEIDLRSLSLSILKLRVIIIASNAIFSEVALICHNAIAYYNNDSVFSISFHRECQLLLVAQATKEMLLLL